MTIAYRVVLPRFCSPSMTTTPAATAARRYRRVSFSSAPHTWAIWVMR
ncbi:hypothetical protein ABZ678_02910 [Streptomyces hirsutus]